MAINETIMQMSVESLPFGGVGESGMGAYHGKVKAIYSKGPSMSFYPDFIQILSGFYPDRIWIKSG